MATDSTIDVDQIASNLKLAVRQVARTTELLDEGNTVPFITRYRKDQTGGLDEVQIRAIQEQLARIRQLVERKQTILRSIDSQGKLTPELAAAIESALSVRLYSSSALIVPGNPFPSKEGTQFPREPPKYEFGNLSINKGSVKIHFSAKSC